MIQFKQIFFRSVLACVPAFVPAAAVAFNPVSAAGDAECVYVTWQGVPGATCYRVGYSGAGLADVVADPELVRQYPDCVRLDIPGLAAGDYSVRIVAADAGGVVLDECVVDNLTVRGAVREGFAFTGGNVPGAYNLDGTLKEGADVLYVTASTVNSVTLNVVKDKKGASEVKTGLAAILEAIGKGYHKRPLAVRIIGNLTDTRVEGLKDGNYLNLQGNNATDRRLENVTIEGIGTDATLYGYGICFKRTRNIEVRNVAIMLFGDDAVSMDTDNSNIWLHNIDFFYGRPGKDADQVKGDGSIDMKYRSTDITIDHNHFFDSGKVMGCGGTTGEDENLRITFHHNWFDHADSRCPRLHYTTAHVYNNYYDGVPTYCIGNTTESSAFVESNYFRNSKRPMMISGQGTDSYDTNTGTYTLKGTFSGQDGGMTKAYNNLFAGTTVPKLVYQTQHATQFDAYLVESRDEVVPATVKSVKGAWSYSNFDTDATMYVSSPDEVETVPELVTKRSGRLCQGDFKWQFDNSVDDESHSVNAPLKAALSSYTGSLVAVQGDADFGSAGILPIVDDNAAAPVLYDLNGRPVDMATVPAGIYISRRGTAAARVVVR